MGLGRRAAFRLAVPEQFSNDSRTAHLAAELGVLAFKQGYAQWLEAHDGVALAPYTLAALEDLRAASESLT